MPPRTNPFAGVIPPPDTIRHNLDRAEAEVRLLRRLLRLSLRREREAQRLRAQPAGGEDGHAT